MAANMYAYANGNPVMMIDPDGRVAVWVIVVGVIVGIAAVQAVQAVAKAAPAIAVALAGIMRGLDGLHRSQGSTPPGLVWFVDFMIFVIGTFVVWLVELFQRPPPSYDSIADTIRNLVINNAMFGA